MMPLISTATTLLPAADEPIQRLGGTSTFVAQNGALPPIPPHTHTVSFLLSFSFLANSPSSHTLSPPCCHSLFLGHSSRIPHHPTSGVRTVHSNTFSPLVSCPVCDGVVLSSVTTAAAQESTVDAAEVLPSPPAVVAPPDDIQVEEGAEAPRRLRPKEYTPKREVCFCCAGPCIRTLGSR